MKMNLVECGLTPCSEKKWQIKGSKQYAFRKMFK